MRVVVLRAPAGSKVWSAGRDVAELPRGRRDPLGWSDPLRVLVRAAVQEFPAPLIALIEGSVRGGGFEVAIACDILVARPETTFATTPAKLGLPYNLGGVLTLLNASGRQGDAVHRGADPASQALNLGIINYIKTADEIEDFVYRMARGITVNAPLAISVMKEELRLLAGAHSITPELFERIQGLRPIVYDSRDYQEGIDAFRGKRRPQFRGE